MPVGEIRETPASPLTDHYQLRSWWDRYGLLAGITSSTLDFTLGGSPPVGHARQCWDAFLAQYRDQFTAVIAGYQCHGARVLLHQKPGPGLTLAPETDGHVTAAPGVLLAVTVADCVPVYLAAADGSVVGLIHAGWRGIAAGIVEVGIERLRTATADRSTAHVSHCGIAICGSCYEVGPEVVTAVAGRRASASESLDLRATIAQRLRVAGVHEVTLSPWCTAHDGGRFHSHRASRGRAGRMLAYVGRSLDPPPLSR
jgi:hypothetical protein